MKRTKAIGACASLALYVSALAILIGGGSLLFTQMFSSAPANAVATPAQPVTTDGLAPRPSDEDQIDPNRARMPTWLAPTPKYSYTPPSTPRIRKQQAKTDSVPKRGRKVEREVAEDASQGYASSHDDVPMSAPVKSGPDN